MVGAFVVMLCTVRLQLCVGGGDAVDGHCGAFGEALESELGPLAERGDHNVEVLLLLVQRRLLLLDIVVVVRLLERSLNEGPVIHLCFETEGSG